MITTEIKESKVTETKFPKLMKSINSNLIVMFQGLKVGIALVGDCANDAGEYSTDWAMKYFEDFNDELILKNN